VLTERFREIAGVADADPASDFSNVKARAAKQLLRLVHAKAAEVLGKGQAELPLKAVGDRGRVFAQHRGHFVELAA
jgi:hypothetical protein